ncbi:cytoplasmic tRNA 2-thiolation protein 2-like isoform X2 [Gossypium australe]|uniref:Cytoplasmic tRNA 2-thiolation protein 2-like isoform X2 n=1 Tax=Gossypium australe TaxID=47621 RepID=A0A5B6WPI5_9ROSI|nr:cytoplasmic tRNA 2-thiolation protein 2-like isoform X2 [Gossypium australe]
MASLLKELVVVPIESNFSSDGINVRERLKKLLGVVSDVTVSLAMSLSNSIQYVDSRWEIPNVLPLHDCPTQDLNTPYSLDGLKIVELLNGLCSDINCSSFVEVL